MGTIKDIIDLVTQFSNSIKDREMASHFREIQSLLAQLQSDIFQLQQKLLDCEKEKAILEQKLNEQRGGEVCPFCRRPAGNLLKIEPHQLFGDVGVKTGYYKCRNCQKEYDREIQP